MTLPSWVYTPGYLQTCTYWIKMIMIMIMMMMMMMMMMMISPSRRSPGSSRTRRGNFTADGRSWTNNSWSDFYVLMRTGWFIQYIIS